MKRFIKFESFKNRNVLLDFVVALKLYQKFQLFASVTNCCVKYEIVSSEGLFFFIGWK